MKGVGLAGLNDRLGWIEIAGCWRVEGGVLWGEHTKKANDFYN